MKRRADPGALTFFDDEEIVSAPIERTVPAYKLIPQPKRPDFVMKQKCDECNGRAHIQCDDQALCTDCFLRSIRLITREIRDET